jgi:phosphoribosyl 1,2-cyclic phosphodiesterase
MKAVMLGTGAADIASPRVCTCANCQKISQIDGHSLRTYASLLLDDELLVDCGATVPAQMKRLAPAALARNVLITHIDYDHVDPRALAQLPTDAMQFDLPVYGSPAVVSIWRYEAQCHLDMHTLRPFEPVHVGEYQVLPLSASHRGAAGDSLIFVISRDGRSLLYACDTGWLPRESAEALGNTPLAVVAAEATFGLKTEGIPDVPAVHMNFPLVCKLREELCRHGVIGDATPFFATHLSLHHCPPHEESEAWLAERGVTLAFDGLQFEW